MSFICQVVEQRVEGEHVVPHMMGQQQLVLIKVFSSQVVEQRVEGEHVVPHMMGQQQLVLQEVASDGSVVVQGSMQHNMQGLTQVNNENFKKFLLKGFNL